MREVDHDQLLEEAFQLLGRTMVRMDLGRLDTWVAQGLTITQMRVLFILRGNAGLTAGALSDRLGVTPPTVTRIIDRLVENDLVRREVDRQDRRCVRHDLSQEGLAAIAKIERAGRALMMESLQRLSPVELERLVAALGDLLAVEAGQQLAVETEA